jgi:hypothetical protein
VGKVVGGNRANGADFVLAPIGKKLEAEASPSS